MYTCIRTVLTTTAAILALVLMLPASASAQNPANCNANLLDITISRDTLATRPGEIVNYDINVINRTVIGPQIGCNTLDVSATFFCPDATGAPNGPSTPLFTDVDIPANNVIAPFGPFPCIMPDIDPGIATAAVRGGGFLDDGVTSPFLINKDIAVIVQSCLVQVDKQISCDGGTTWFDQGLVFANEGGSQGCTTTDGTAILVRYQVRNAGTAPLHACVLTETNTAFGAPGSLPTPIAPLTTLAFIPALQSPLCSDSLENNEPDTAAVNCFCQADLNPEDKVSASDSADLTCQSSSQLSLTKVCADPGVDGTNLVTITAEATDADLGLVNCHVVDTIFLDDPSCEAPVVGAGTNVTVAPADFNLAAGDNQIVTGSVGPLTSNACNTASISCTVETTGAPVTATADAVCPGQGEGCITRTPGFWGTHPAITAEFLNVEVCGVTLDSVGNNDHSAIEAVCSVGKDGKILGPQLTQLVRQCTAAALNIAASVEGSGNCSSAFPNLDEQMAACCSAESACTGFPSEGFTVNSCIGLLDAFNNSIDTLDPFGPFVGSQRANPSVCQGSKGNNVVVTPDAP